MLRTFIAVPIPSIIKQNLMQTQADMKKHCQNEIKWVSEESLHVTLNFLGDIEENLVEPIGQRLTQLFQNEPQFSIQLSNVGCFPDPQRAKVVWVGIQDPMQRLSHFNQILSKAMKEFGIEPEKKEYSPHITLGRIRYRAPNNFVEILNQYCHVQFGTMTVNSVILYKSVLQPQGSIYSALATTYLSKD